MIIKEPSLGAVLREMRKAAKLSQVALGRIVGLTSGAMSRLEAGQRSTTSKVLIAWAETCGFELRAIPVGAGQTVDIGHLHPEHQEAVRTLARRLPQLEPVARELLLVQIAVLRERGTE